MGDKKDIKILPVKFPGHVKKQIEDMSEETGITQAALIKMATQSMLINYKNKGSFIFADLLNPEHKE